MLNINFLFNDISVNSIKEVDINKVSSYLAKENDVNNKIFNLKEFNDRFLEYYISESEFFLKAEQNNKIICIVKGRIEFKNENQVWFWYINGEDHSLSSLVLNKLIEYFKSKFFIYNFYAIAEEKSPLIEFYEDNKFSLSRVSKNFFKLENHQLDMFILKLS